MSQPTRAQLMLRWLWLLSMVVVSAALPLPAVGWIVLGLACGLALWLTLTTPASSVRAPSRPWMLGMDLALGVGLVAIDGSWLNPYLSGWLLLGVIEGQVTGRAGGLRLASLGLVLSGVFLTVLHPPTLSDLLSFSLVILGVLLSTWLLLGLWQKLSTAEIREPTPIRVLDERAGSSSILDAAVALSSAVQEAQLVERALDLALGCAPPAGGPCRAALMLFGESGWAVRGARRLTATDRQAALAEPVGLLAQAVAAGGAVVSQQPEEDAALVGMSALRECPQAACVALWRGGLPAGAMFIGWPDPAPPSPAVLSDLTAIGRLASAALEGLSRVDRVEGERQRQGDVQEESRRRLARDLHDGPTQAVASLAMRLNYIGKLVDRDPAAARKELTTAEEMARRATRDIRHMLFALRPLILESQGLVPALWQLAQKIHEVQGEQVIVEAERDDAEGMSPLQQSITFYIAEEAINNAVKHAQAKNIWVRLAPRNAGWRLEIEDDGVGFNVGAVDEDYAQRGSLGLVSMRERAALAGGDLRIESREAHGTRIEVHIPRRSDPAEG